MFTGQPNEDGMFVVEINEQYKDDNDTNGGWRTFPPDELIDNFCCICMVVEEDEDLLECNSCRIGSHRDCCLENNKILADDISDQDKTFFVTIAKRM
jgi:hypothetical protein